MQTRPDLWVSFRQVSLPWQRSVSSRVDQREELRSWRMSSTPTWVTFWRVRAVLLGCRASPRLLEEGVPLTLLFPLSVCRGAGFWRRHPEVCRCVLRRRQSQRPADAQHLPWEPPGFHPAICGEQRGTALSPALSRASTGALRHGRSGGGEGALSLSAEGHWRGGGGWRPHCCPPPPTLLLCCPGGRCSWPGRWEGSLRPGCPGGPSG